MKGSNVTGREEQVLSGRNNEVWDGESRKRKGEEERRGYGRGQEVLFSNRIPSETR